VSRDFSFRVAAPCTAPPAITYQVLDDVDCWHVWMPGVREAQWESSAEEADGPIRSMRARGITVREQIVVADAPHHQGYVMLSGLPVKNYRGDVRIEPRADGCLITWEARFNATIPATGNLIRLAMRASFAKIASALAREAQRRYGAAS
jgi:hypothetical protein